MRVFYIIYILAGYNIVNSKYKMNWLISVTLKISGTKITALFEDKIAHTNLKHWNQQYG